MTINLISILLSVLTCFAGPEIINMRDFGLTASERGNVVEKVGNALEYGKSLCKPFEIVFEKGEYFINLGDPSGAEESLQNYLFVLDGLEDVTIDGGGSEFVFKGIAGFARIARCRNIELRHFSIDWKRPYITQAVIRDCGSDWMDLEIDKDQYPYKITGEEVRYICEDGEYGVAEGTYCNYFTPDGRIMPGSLDNYWMESLLESPAEELSDGVIRFHGKVNGPIPKGAILTIYNVRYRTPWATAYDSKDIIVKDITIYHTTGCGIVATVTKNITIDNLDYIPRKDKGRVFSGVADAVHLTNCSGQIIMRNCYMNGQGDDALNIHGRYCKVEQVCPDGKTFRFSTSHGLLLFKQNEKVWFVNSSTMQRTREYTIASAREISQSLFEFSLTENPHLQGEGEWFIESASSCPDVLIENNVFGSGNRARGILLTSPGKMVVRNNVFKSAGTAILVEGDLTYWYESGGVRDLTITGNLFDRCHTSQWGHSVISFSPSPVPDDDSLPRFHRRIRITDNTFNLIEPSVLYARFVEGLVFKNNHINMTEDYPALHNMAGPIVLEHCRDCVTKY